VKYFDDQFDELKRKITAKLGADSKTMAIVDQLGQYAKANPGKTAFVIGALTAVASFAGGPAGGAVAGQVLRGAVELLKGEKLSTAVGRGAKSAAIGGALGAGITALGDYFGNIKVVASQIPGYTQLAKLDFIRQDVQVGGNNPGYFFGDLRGIEIPSQLAPKLKLLLDQVSDYIDRNDWAGAGKFWNEVTAIVDNPEVRQYVKEIAGNNQTLYDQAVANAANFKEVAAKISSTLRAAVQGGLAGASAAPAPAAKTPTAGTATNQVREHHIRLTNKEVHEIFAVAGSLLNEGPMDWLKTKGKNLTTKVTADKLKSMWTKDGKPMDSEKIAAILRQAGVKDDVVASAFNAVEAPVPSWVRTPAAAQPAIEPTAQPATATEPATATATEPATATATEPAAGKSATAAPAMDTDQILKSYEMMAPEQRKQLIKDLEIIDNRDRPFIYPNESRKRQRRI
jgi:2-hydroxychromene-2-carboxylate isomerase